MDINRFFSAEKFLFRTLIGRLCTRFSGFNLSTKVLKVYCIITQNLLQIHRTRLFSIFSIYIHSIFIHSTSTSAGRHLFRETLFHQFVFFAVDVSFVTGSVECHSFYVCSRTLVSVSFSSVFLTSLFCTSFKL